MTTQQQLQNLFCLDHNIRVYIPSTNNVNEKTDNAEYIADGLRLFSDLFGGATSYDAMGAWLSNSQGVVTEPVKIIESYATKEATAKGLAKVLEFARRIKSELHQEAVSLEYDNKLYFV